MTTRLRDMRLRLEMHLFPSLDELLAVLDDAEAREAFLDPEDVEEERSQWRDELECAAEEAKYQLDVEISRHSGTREDLRNAERDLSTVTEDLADLQKKYDSLVDRISNAYTGES